MEGGLVSFWGKKIAAGSSFKYLPPEGFVLNLQMVRSVFLFEFASKLPSVVTLEQ